MNRKPQKNKPARWVFSTRRTAAAAAVAACFSGVVQANPVNPTVVHGTASFASAGNILNITNSPNAIINWGSFSIGVNELTRFIQQSGSSAVLNRIIGQDPSVILGALQSNGRVFLINPNGIMFGAGAQINVAGLVASTLNLSNDDFLNNRMRFTDGAGAGSVVNQGSISGGSVYLIGKAVTNDGLITSPNGEVILAAGNSVELVNAGTPNLRVEITAPDNEAKNLGTITADAGRIGIYAGLIQQSGTLRADSAVVEGGRIMLKASKNVHLAAASQTSASGTSGGRVEIQAGDTTIVEGDITATGSAGAGGTVQVLGNLVGLTGHASIDASGDTAGGTVLVGGDYQGRNPEVQNAFRTYVGPDVSIKADAVTQGDGGKVIVWADDVTRYYGKISARGGAQGGDGGFVETSSKGYLAVTRAPDISAPAGQGGTWLLDPLNITVTSTDLNILDIDAGIDANFQPTVGSSTIAASTIVGALNGGNVILDTNVPGADAGNIIISSAITAAPGVTRSLTFNANNNIDVNGSITSTSGALNIVFNPGGTVNLGTVTLDGNGGTINAAGKTVNLSGGTATINSDFSIGTLNMSGGATLAGTGNTTVSSAFNWDTTASLGFLSGTGIFTTTGASTLSGAGVNSHRLEGKVWNNSGTASLTGGHFSLNSGATFNNSNIFNVTTSSAIGVDSNGSGTNTFNNSGIVNWNTPGTAGISVVNAFNNTGSVNVNGGTMNVAVGGTDTNGVYTVTSPGVLQFSAGTRTLSGTSNVAGSGQVNYTGGTVNINGGSYGIGTTTIAGGALNFNTPAMVSGTLNLSSGTLGGSANLAAGGVFNWSGGTIGGSGQLITSSTATTNITGSVALAPGKTWSNDGTVNFTGASTVDLGDSTAAIFNNQAGGVVNIVSTAGWSFISDPSTQVGQINNAGTINVNNSTSWEAAFNNAAGATLNIAAGQYVSMQNGKTINGMVNIGAGGTLWVSEFHASPTIFSNTTIGGTGTLQVLGSSPSAKFTNVSAPGATLRLGSGGQIEILNGTSTFAALNLDSPSYGGAFSISNGVFARSAGDLVVPSGSTYSGVTGYAAQGGNLIVNGTVNAPGSITLDASGNVLVLGGGNVSGGTVKLKGGNIVIGDIAATSPASVSASSLLDILSSGNLTIQGGSSAGAYAAVSSTGTLTVNASGDVILAGGSGSGSFAHLLGNPDVVLASVGGVIRMDAGSGMGSYAAIESVSPTSIYATFPNLASGGYFVNGIEGLVYDAATGTGFIAGGSAAIPGTNLVVTYGSGGGAMLGGDSLQVPTQTLIVALTESTEPPDAEKEKDVFKEVEDDKKKDAPVCK